MYSCKLFFQLGLLVCLGLFITSCSENEMDDGEDSEQIENAHSPDAANMMAQGRSDDPSEQDSTETDGEFDDCFTIIYPITISLPDGSTTAVDSDKALEILLEDWYNQNPDAEQGPEFQYPITVDTSGTQIAISNEEEFCELIASCFEENGDDYDEGDFEEFEDDCFEFVFPVTVLYSDGTTTEVTESEMLEGILSDAYEGATDTADVQLPEFQYPVTVTLQDGTEQSVTDAEALDQLYMDCYGDYEDEDDEDCFAIMYPVDILIPGGDVVTVNDEEEEENTIDQYFDANPVSEEYPTFVFPITVTLEEGTEQSVADEAGIDALYESCYDGEGSSGSSEDNDDEEDDDDDDGND